LPTGWKYLVIYWWFLLVLLGFFFFPGGMNLGGVGFFCRWASGRHAAREQESINQRRRKSGPFGCQMPLGRSSDCITVFHPALAIREPVSHRLIIF
jgi:hypothetical protein